MNELEHKAITILYVDDERMACKYFASAVGTDYEVLTALSADAAIAILADPHNRVGVLVTDYRMPGRDGGDLLRQVEREYPHVVRILVTAYVDKSVLLETINSGEVFQILEKPLGLMEIRRVLRMASALARERATKQQKLMAIDETLAFLAHELNAPLETITLVAQEMQALAGAAPENIRAQLGNGASSIANNTSYCLSVLNTFVASIRNSSQSNNENTASTAQQLIASLLATYPLTPAERAMIRVEVQEDFMVRSMPNCVALVLSSVLSNALHAVQGRDAAAIEFCVRINTQPQIVVTDNGVGLSADALQKILNDPSTPTAASSSTHGWGMIFCKRVMQSFGGAIEMHSEPEHGATVILKFPD
ncbi:hybrid sensor histidine kinase/response regulator [Massilia sp. W12]|uniref:hybrid sensor histidine kinase/response regulator n=1 Tax=Massilia sp. W12 TaxID=3126507 RepID=UPI0030CE9B41